MKCSQAQSRRDCDMIALSHKTQLIVTAVAASLATAGLLSAYSSYIKQERRRNLNDEIYRTLASAPETETLPSPSPLSWDVQDGNDLKYDENLIKEQLARTYAFFGEEAMSKIRNGNVVVVGCGGVGSWAAVMLVRS